MEITFKQINLINLHLFLMILLMSIFIIASINCIKNITNTFLSFKSKEKIKFLWPLLSYIFGVALGIFIFTYELLINIILVASVGYFSPVIYRILLKSIMKKFNIEISQNGSLRVIYNNDDDDKKG